MKLNKENKAYEKISLYLEERAKKDPYLQEKLNLNLEFSEMINYIVSEAKKVKNGNAAILTDEEVYELAAHFILEEGKVKAEKTKAKITVDDTEDEDSEEEDVEIEETEVKEKPKKEKKAKAKSFEQMSLFEL